MTNAAAPPSARKKHDAPPSGRASIIDVARHAGVSVGTVSNVLNGRSSVRKERRARVLEAMNELGYTCNLLAQGMRLQRSRVVGLCVPFATYPNFSAITDSLEDQASESGFQLMQVTSRQEAAKEYARIVRLVAYKVGGLLLVPSIEPGGILDFLHANSVPTIIVNRPVANEERFDQVMVDHRGVMYRVARELIARGHRKIVLAAQYPTLTVTRERIEGIKQAVADAAEQVQFTVMITGKSQQEFGAQMLSEASGKHGHVVMIASNSLIASWAIRCVRELGIRYPEDMSLLTLDEPEWATIVTPSLSVVSQPTAAISKMAWSMLAERMEGSTLPARRTLLNAEIIFRDSVADLA
ncbi:LacI family transcriptional regulator [Bosea caraganae]|uniref:LacI family transcriptional regulator n=1 Tax=Bosea caraganae TaxID=2763117 RepID=A0A370L9R4_9HYPH|nr:LacI family DNA-binding transcriptional regulator [Bosea caraganae]RDJ21903.1 LacI family transcriptional regulator [Bosea caraganae]RDJ28065.1 LacI family transcriptional regulator [Bosea caraganae]